MQLQQKQKTTKSQSPPKKNIKNNTYKTDKPKEIILTNNSKNNHTQNIQTINSNINKSPQSKNQKDQRKPEINVKNNMTKKIYYQKIALTHYVNYQILP